MASMRLLMFLAAVMATAPLMALSFSDGQSPKAVEAWFKRLPQARQKLTKLHFYFYDVVTGENVTAVEVGRANITSESPTFFGLVRVFDIPITVEPERDSKRVGYAQGIYTLSSQEEVNIYFSFTFLFTEGKYNGSSLSVEGLSPFNWRFREIPIVGGSGVFRLARGSAIASTYWNDFTKQNGIVEFTLLVQHYDDEELQPVGDM